jgi:hypothetical protein
VANAHVSMQSAHVSRSKHVTNQTIVLTKIKAVVLTRHNTRCILSAMLQNCKRVKQGLVCVGFSNDTDNTAHGIISSQLGVG